MTLQCANSSCCRPLTSFSEGRLFQFEITSISVSAVDEQREEFDETPKRDTANFWLCSQCAKTMTLTMEPIEGLRLVPLDATSGVNLRPPATRELRDS